MSKPAARIGDMHLCPMITPGVPPIPHVGGPIIGPGVPTVLIGNMPAAVMGDMCVCVGPPDSIILGSTGVLIGGKPAARMGDTTVHGGSIILGCPTVLIGEISPGTIMTKTSLTILEQFKPESEQVISMQQAAEAGKPFCEVCTPASQDTNQEENTDDENKDKQIKECYFLDENDMETSGAREGDYVFFIIESNNMVGEEVEIDFSDNTKDFEYNGKKLDNDILKITLKSDREKLKIKVIDQESKGANNQDSL